MVMGTYTQEQAFARIKDELTRLTVLQLYNPQKKVKVFGVFEVFEESESIFRSDNGRQYNAWKTKEFAKAYRFVMITSSPEQRTRGADGQIRQHSY